MTQAIEKRQNGESGLALELWGRERLDVLKQQIAPGASDAELDLFATVCKRTRLDPFARQIWSIPRRRKVNDQGGREYWEQYQVIQIGVHGLRLIAQRSREYAGQDGPYWCGADGKWTDTWLLEEAPKAARVGVRRKGFPEPTYSVAVWDRAVQRDSRGQPMALWKTRGPEQLALAAERDALRRSFPLETSELEVVMDDDEEQAANAQRYAEIFDEDDVEVSGDHLVNRTTGEVVDDVARGQQIIERAHAAARSRDEDLDRLEAERQRKQEGLI
jgi:hypothetical protein